MCSKNKTKDLNLSVLNMITGINEWKTLTSIYHANVKVNLMEEKVIQINGWITINVDGSVKNIIYEKNIIFRILLHVVVKMENM